VAPQRHAARHGRDPQVRPRRCQPGVVVAITYPDPRQVIGVVVHFHRQLWASTLCAPSQTLPTRHRRLMPSLPCRPRSQTLVL
jgi:hypothetical protein